MTNIVNKYNLEGVYIGPAPATGNHFMHESGVITPNNTFLSGPLLFWPDIQNREYTFVNLTNIQTGIEFSGFKNVTKISPNSSNAIHSLRVSPLAPFTYTSFTGLVYVECEYFIPSTNTDVSRLLFIKNNNTVGGDGDATAPTGYDKWLKYSNIRLINFSGSASDYLSFTLCTGAGVFTTSSQIYAGNPSDSCYFRNFKAIGLSGFSFLNLIQPLERVQSVTYNLNIPQQNITQIGQKSTLIQSSIENPTVNLEITTIQNILANENKIGFNLNYPRFFSGYNGQATFDSFNYDILSRFTSRRYTGVSGLFYPLEYADKRNIFISISSGNTDKSQELNNINNSTYGFGNCYLSSYSWSMELGQLPITRFNYICENAEFYNNGFGQLPSLVAKTANKPSGQYFIIPNMTGNNNIVSTNPLDSIITLNNINYGGNLNTENLGVDFNDLKIQSVNFEINLERRNLDSIGYQLPINRKINYPVFINLNIEAIVGKEYIGSLNTVFKNNSLYDINIKLNNKCNNIAPASYKDTLVQYDFKGANLNNISYNSSIGTNKSVTLNFIQEIDIENNMGLFISGLVYGNTFQTTGTTNNLLFRPIEFIHKSGEFNYFNSRI